MPSAIGEVQFARIVSRPLGSSAELVATRRTSPLARSCTRSLRSIVRISCPVLESITQRVAMPWVKGFAPVAYDEPVTTEKAVEIVRVCFARLLSKPASG